MKKRNILTRKSLVTICSILSLLLMIFKSFEYVSSSNSNRGTIEAKDGFSLYDFLFNGKLIVGGMEVKLLRDLFNYSYVVMYLGLFLIVIALGLSIYGLFSKKTIASKISSIILVLSVVVLSTIVFDRSVMSITTRYISLLTPCFVVFVLLVIGSFLSTITLKDK